MPFALSLLGVLAVVVLSLASPPARACSVHGTQLGSDIQTWSWGDVSGDGQAEFLLGIENELVLPTAATTCVCGIGLGSGSRAWPPGGSVVGARITMLNVESGATTDLTEFEFVPNSTTSAGLEVGGGSGAEPIVPGATWFGFAANVSPFVLPPLGPNEIFALAFDVELREASLPLAIDVQFSAGEGDSTGAPQFGGVHPPTYFTGQSSRAVLAPEPKPSALAGVALAALAAIAKSSRRAQCARPFGATRTRRSQIA